jgi:hypothetical protein
VRRQFLQEITNIFYKYKDIYCDHPSERLVFQYVSGAKKGNREVAEIAATSNNVSFSSVLPLLSP